MNDIIILRFVAHEGPAFLGDFLQQRGLDYQVIKIDEGDAVPETIQGISGLVLMGGPMSVNDPLPWIPQVQFLVREAQDAGIPILGHCLGAQLIATAMGAIVGKNKCVEIGWHHVSIVDQESEWLQGLDESFEAFHWHGETFSVPEQANRILGNKHCPNQGFTMGNTLALQCHVEMTAELVRQWVKINSAELVHPHGAVQSTEQITQDLDEKIVRLQHIADVLYRQWIARLP
ncbi:MAG: GMP synthase [Gammaproteobacteria bacterium]|nr:MAG: GMP synthase [Gammaproteobacteria bacterium]